MKASVIGLRTFTDRLAFLGRGPVAWAGASSFEPRCTGSLRSLKAENASVTKAIRFDYGSRTTRQSEAESLRASNRAEQQNTLDALGCREVEVVSLMGLPTSAFVRELSDFVLGAAASRDQVVIDISCFTRLHVVAIASLMTALAKSIKVSIAYTLPQNYTTMAERRDDFEGFARVVIAPIVDGASLRSESRARGIILLSHESQRLLVALSEFEPSGGLMVQPLTEGRPDFASVARQRNRRIVKRLLRFDGWTGWRVNFRDVNGLSRLVKSEAYASREADGPLMLYPFGPKSFVFASALTAAQIYPEASWFVYPMPTFYDPFPTEGVGETYWTSLFDQGYSPAAESLERGAER